MAVAWHTGMREIRADLDLDDHAARRPDRIRPERRPDPQTQRINSHARSVGLRLEREPQDGAPNETLLYRIFSGKLLLARYWVTSKTLEIDGREHTFPTIESAIIAIAQQRKLI